MFAMLICFFHDVMSSCVGLHRVDDFDNSSIVSSCDCFQMLGLIDLRFIEVTPLPCCYEFICGFASRRRLLRVMLS